MVMRTVERIPQHRHCRDCEKAIPADQEYCSKECEEHRSSAVRAKKRQLQIFYVVMIVIFIFAIMISFA